MNTTHKDKTNAECDGPSYDYGDDSIRNLAEQRASGCRFAEDLAIEIQNAELYQAESKNTKKVEKVLNLPQR